MQSVVVSLILASAFLHALWNAVLKQQRDPEVAAVAILGVAAILAIAAVPFAGGPSFPGPHGFAWAMAAGICEGGYFLTLALGLRDAPLGIVYAIARGGALAAVWPVSVLWLGEEINVLSIAGVIAVVAGLVLVSIDSRPSHVHMKGLLWAALCALFIAGYHVCYKCALATGAAPTAVFAAALGIALPINVARLGQRSLSRISTVFRAKPFTLGFAGALCSASFLAFLFALAQGGAGAVITLRNTSVVFVLIMAWAIGERPAYRQVMGILGVTVGAVILSWPP